MNFFAKTTQYSLGHIAYLPKTFFFTNFLCYCFRFLFDYTSISSYRSSSVLSYLLFYFNLFCTYQANVKSFENIIKAQFFFINSFFIWSGFQDYEGYTIFSSLSYGFYLLHSKYKGKNVILIKNLNRGKMNKEYNNVYKYKQWQYDNSL